ncbi:MAG: amino acid permease [Pseudomonadales bacterium]|nr:amino acid permease [Pseudomonadales bacterium]
MKKFDQKTAVSVVIANMVGTGVFTSLGFQLLDIQSVSLILLLWIVGGIIALCGALTYAELGAQLPRSGGEYHFLSQLYHPGLGFVSGWISITVGFAAPIALAAMTFGAYLSAAVGGVNQTLAAALLVGVLGFLHCYSRATSGKTQVLFTALKVILIVVFSVAALIASDYPVALPSLPAAGDLTSFKSGAFAVALIYVNYAYTGWNSATYLIDELEDPTRRLPRVLFVGTLSVMGFYLLLNFVFLSVAPIEALQGQLEIGVIAAQYAFGATGGQLMGLMLSLLLISTVSAMLMAGPRVLLVIGQDFPAFGWMAKTNASGMPFIAILSVVSLSMVLVLTSSFESVLVFSGFVLSLNTLLTVGGVFRLRALGLLNAERYQTWGYPVTPLLYLGLTLWTLIYILIQRPTEGLMGLLVVAIGGIFYGLTEAAKSKGP